MTTKQMLSEWKRERHKALLSLDREKIEAYARKYLVPLPANEISFWGAIHMARLKITSMPDEAKRLSRQWLREHDFKTFTGADPND